VRQATRSLLVRYHYSRETWLVFLCASHAEAISGTRTLTREDHTELRERREQYERALAGEAYQPTQSAQSVQPTQSAQPNQPATR
jgi:hypothetical protein